MLVQFANRRESGIGHATAESHLFDFGKTSQLFDKVKCGLVARYVHVVDISPSAEAFVGCRDTSSVEIVEEYNLPILIDVVNRPAMVDGWNDKTDCDEQCACDDDERQQETSQAEATRV